MVRNQEYPVKTDTKSFYSWFSGQPYRQERGAPGSYPAIRVYPTFSKRWFTGRTAIMFIAGIGMYGSWMRPERERYSAEMLQEHQERIDHSLVYQNAEIRLRYYLSAYKRYRYETECLMTKGYAGVTPESRKFFYHDDVWRPALHDVIQHPFPMLGGPLFSYNWGLGYW